MKNIRDFYRLANAEANEGNVYVSTVTTGALTGAKALWHDGGLLSVFPSESADFWQGQVAPKPIGSSLYQVEYNNEQLEIFAEPLQGGSRLIICGGGHVSLPVATIGTMLGFDVTVIDDRSFFANAQRFPTANVICKSFEEALSGIRGNSDYYVIVTRGHQYDIECLRIILNKTSCYVGMIGSKHRVKLVKDTLLNEGYTTEKIDELHSPIGLKIGAETPEEIAVAIMGEIISVKSNIGGISGSAAAERQLLSTPSVAQALVTIVKRRGSAPRTAGTKMIVQADGRCIGTIGGGCVESEAIQRAMSAIEQKQSRRYTVDITGAEASDEGMVCGGIVDIMIEPLD